MAMYKMELELGPNAYPTVHIKVETSERVLLDRIKDAIEQAYNDWTDEQ